MPSIFDNIAENSQLVTALKRSVRASQRADFCVGYFNLRGWKAIADDIDAWAGGDGEGGAAACCRVLVGMQGRPEEELRSQLAQYGDAPLMDNATAVRQRKNLALAFRDQLTFGAPTNRDDTAHWIAAELARALPKETVAVYAGVGRSGIFQDDHFNAVEREPIKAAVRTHEIRLLVATDAACEGLNLQTLGTLINVDLPWNPSRLEQRLGRIKRFGQVRRTVDMLNLVYHQTRDEDVYAVLSKRLRDQYDIFGGLPDTIEDKWIENIQILEQQLDQYIHLREETRRNVFDLRYETTVEPEANRWETCARVLSRQDIVDRLSEPW